jgi:hypothetical protein
VATTRKKLVDIVVVVYSQSDLLQVISTLTPSCGFPSRLHSGQKQSNQNPDNCNHYQELNQCKSGPSSHGEFLRFRKVCRRTTRLHEFTLGTSSRERRPNYRNKTILPRGNLPSPLPKADPKKTSLQGPQKFNDTKREALDRSRFPNPRVHALKIAPEELLVNKIEKIFLCSPQNLPQMVLQPE